jgi:hypothetical protein
MQLATGGKNFSRALAFGSNVARAGGAAIVRQFGEMGKAGEGRIARELVDCSLYHGWAGKRLCLAGLRGSRRAGAQPTQPVTFLSGRVPRTDENTTTANFLAGPLRPLGQDRHRGPCSHCVLPRCLLPHANSLRNTRAKMAVGHAADSSTPARRLSVCSWLLPENF